MWSSNLFPVSSCFWCFSRTRFFRVLVFQGTGFSGSRFFRVQVFQDTGFSEYRFFQVQVFWGAGPGFRSSPIFSKSSPHNLVYYFNSCRVWICSITSGPGKHSAWTANNFLTSKELFYHECLLNINANKLLLLTYNIK